MTRGSPQTKYRNATTDGPKPKVVVSFTADAATLEALEALVDRLAADDQQIVSASAAIRRAVVYMERLTRKGDQ